MVYSYGARFDDDSNAITVIDEENQTSNTTGYINGEYIEFDSNPNSVQVITGTADNPCAGIDARTLLNAISEGNASATIYLHNDSLGISVTMPIIAIDINLKASTINSDTMSGFDARWKCSGANAEATLLVMINNGNPINGTSYASTITSELTICWHPLPEE